MLFPGGCANKESGCGLRDGQCCVCLHLMERAWSLIILEFFWGGLHAKAHVELRFILPSSARAIYNKSTFLPMNSPAETASRGALCVISAREPSLKPQPPPLSPLLTWGECDARLPACPLACPAVLAARALQAQSLISLCLSMCLCFGSGPVLQATVG